MAPGSALIFLAVLLSLYAAFVLLLAMAGRRGEARALAGFIPDCIVLFCRLLSDSRVPRGRKLALLALVAYLAMPFDFTRSLRERGADRADGVWVAIAALNDGLAL